MADAVNPAQELVDQEFPEAIRPLVPPAFRRAYAAVDRVMNHTPFLDTPSGRYQRGDLIVKAAEFEFFRLATAGSLPFEASWQFYANPTGKHLVLRGKSSRTTINQVQDPKTKPRYAVFRDSFAIPNMEYLFPDMNEEAKRENNLKHIALLHGYQSLAFVVLGVPDPLGRSLIWRTDNLMSIPHAVPATADEDGVPAEEGPAESPDLETLDDLNRFLRDGE